MAKSFEYAEEHELIDFEQQVMSPLYVVDVLRCTYQLSTAERLLEVRDAIRSELPNTRTKNGYSANAKAPMGYRDMKLNVLFKCGESGSVITEVQLMLSFNVESKKKMHAVYRIVRGDFSTADVDSHTHTMKRKALAVALAPDMRTLQQEALRELSTGAMTGAVLLSYFDLGTTVAVGFTYLQIGTPSSIRSAYTTFGMLIGSLALQAIMNWATGQGVVATVVTIFGGKPVFDAYNVIYDKPMGGGQNPLLVMSYTRCYEVCFDALPQSVMQAIILVQLADDERDYLLWVSLIFSALSISYLVVTMIKN